MYRIAYAAQGNSYAFKIMNMQSTNVKMSLEVLYEFFKRNKEESSCPSLLNTKQTSHIIFTKLV